MDFVFVGERPSKRAEQIGATWQNGRLAAKTLRAALEAANINPLTQEYVNLWQGAEANDADLAHEVATIAFLYQRVTAGAVVIGMGALVCKTLARYGVPHRKMVHPAARGQIRATDKYQAHVRAVLCGY